MPLESGSEKKITAGAGVAAGSGTLLALIANNMSDENMLKPWLILAAPSLSIIFGSIWVWLQIKIVNYIREREFKLVISEAKKTVEQELEDPNLSNERRDKLKQMREELNQIEIDRVMTKLKSLRIITEKDILK